MQNSWRRAWESADEKRAGRSRGFTEPLRSGSCGCGHTRSHRDWMRSSGAGWRPIQRTKSSTNDRNSPGNWPASLPTMKRSRAAGGHAASPGLGAPSPAATLSSHVVWCDRRVRRGGLRHHPVSAMAGQPQIYATTVGEQRTIVLPDQSRMALNTDTEVRIFYRSSARGIEIRRGEATFSVVRDTQRPFEGATRRTALLARSAPNSMSSRSRRRQRSRCFRDSRSRPCRSDGSAATQSITLRHGNQVTRSDIGFSTCRASGSQSHRRLAFRARRVRRRRPGTGAGGIQLLHRNTHRAGRILARPGACFRGRSESGTNALLQALDRAFGIRAEVGAKAIELRSRDAR